MAKGVKISLISLLSIIVTGCLGIIVWYLSIYFFGNEKVVSKTFYVGELILADGTSENIIEVEYFSNKDGSGYEAFEIKYTYFMDENKINSYSQGYQYIANPGTNIDFGYEHNDLSEEIYSNSNGSLGWKEKYYTCQNSNAPTSNVSVYNYMFDGNKYILSTNPISLNSYFKIQIGEDLYLMQFRGTDTPRDDSTFIGTKRVYHNIWSADKYHNMYFVYDAHYLSRLLYESLKTVNLGANQNIVFEFGNLFNYYKYNAETGQYDNSKTNYDETVKLNVDIKSYYSIRVNVHENGLTNSNDSMFGSILGNQNFNLNGDYSSGDYFVGSTIVNVGINDFYLVPITESHVALKLNDDFVDYYSKYKNSIKLSIVIDIDILSSVGYEFKGFTVDSNLDKFKIYECYTSSGGIKVEDINIQEVIYE